MIKNFLLVLLITAIVFGEELPIKKGSEKYHENGELKRIKLTQPTTVQGMPCMRWLWFYPNGAIDEFQTSEDIVLQDVSIPKYSTVFLREDSTLKAAWLHHDITIQGYPCAGSRWSKTSTGFHPNGRLRYFFPRKPLTIQGFPVKPGGLSGVYFYENGALHKFYLSKDVEIGGQLYKKGIRLILDEAGHVIETYQKTFWKKYFPMFR